MFMLRAMEAWEQLAGNKIRQITRGLGPGLRNLNIKGKLRRSTGGVKQKSDIITVQFQKDCSDSSVEYSLEKLPQKIKRSVKTILQ